ncbi:MAG: polynucleotide 5'-hydroxyl-kinase [Candidatus Omnitrophica bacterium]|nr:polynucleotide 5'-hydroxyl-kinase [Candidatus Omnitrophota bacterium]
MEKLEILKKDEFDIFLSREINKVIFIGGPDTGKTTLIKNIANFLFENKQDIYILDCDIGQSNVGPPTTIGYAKLTEKIKDDFYLNPDKFYFVGSVTPVNCIIEFLTGISRINDYISKIRGKFLIDTTGYIKDIGISLKIHKIEILRPDFVILLEKENELEYIIRFLKNSTISYRRIKIENLPSKSLEERADYRKARFFEYFQNLKEIELNLNDISVKIINFKNTTDFLNINLRNFLCSLKNEYFEDLSLGIIKMNEKERIKILVPEKTKTEKIKGITISNFLIGETIF